MILACENMKIELHFLSIILQCYLSSLQKQKISGTRKDGGGYLWICQVQFEGYTWIAKRLQRQVSGYHEPSRLRITQKNLDHKPAKTKEDLGKGKRSVTIVELGGQPDVFAARTRDPPGGPFIT
jgi:hypothetical protein